jgi:hypothetical protein
MDTWVEKTYWNTSLHVVLKIIYLTKLYKNIIIILL